MDNIIDFDKIRDEILTRRTEEYAEGIRNAIYIEYLNGGVDAVEKMIRYVSSSTPSKFNPKRVIAELLVQARYSMESKDANELITRFRNADSQPNFSEWELTDEEIDRSDEIANDVLSGKVNPIKLTTEELIENLNALAIYATDDDAVLHIEKQDDEFDSGMVVLKDGVELNEAQQAIGSIILCANDIQFRTATLKDGTTAVIIEYKGYYGMAEEDRIEEIENSEEYKAFLESMNDLK